MVAILHCSANGDIVVLAVRPGQRAAKLGYLRPGITLALISSMWMCLPFTRELCDEPTQRSTRPGGLRQKAQGEAC